MPADVLTLLAGFGGILVGIVGALLLVRYGQKPDVSVGIGGSLVVLGLLLVARTYDLIYGTFGWVVVGSALFILGASSYVASRRSHPRL